MGESTKLCDFSNLPQPLSYYDRAMDIVIGIDELAVVLRRGAAVFPLKHEPIVYRSKNKFNVRAAIREANDTLDAIHRLKGDLRA